MVSGRIASGTPLLPQSREAASTITPPPSIDGGSPVDNENPYASPQATDERPQGFDLWPILSFTALVLLLGIPIFSPPMLLVTLAIVVGNGVAAVLFLIAGKPRLISLASLSCLCWIATLLLTDWGFSSLKPIVRLCWPAFIPAVASLLGWVGWPIWKISFERIRRANG